MNTINEMIKIVPFENIHAAAFKQLTLEWLEGYDLFEPADLKYLDNPKSNILEQGGRILLTISSYNENRLEVTRLMS